MNRKTNVGKFRLDISGIVSHVRGVRRTIDGKDMSDVTSLNLETGEHHFKPKQESDEYRGAAKERLRGGAEH